jgi:ornithine carbamoyltransferase
MSTFEQLTDRIGKLDLGKMYENDFFLTWEKTADEIAGVFAVADALRYLRENNVSARIFDSGLAISLFRDNSTRTRFSFASACNLWDSRCRIWTKKNHRSRMGDGAGDREYDFLYGRRGGNKGRYVHRQGQPVHADFAGYVNEGYADGVLEQRPALVNLQCDIDHPTQTMADMLHVIHHFGGG